jgi:CHAT domain-containing protein
MSSNYLGSSAGTPLSHKRTLLVAAQVLLVFTIWPSQCGRGDHGHVILVGDRVEGQLPASDPNLGKSSTGPSRQWTFTGQAGQTVTITAESYEFDALLLLLDPTGREISWADDNREFNNAGITTTLPVAGSYSVVISGANSDQFGTYWLSVQDGEARADWTRAGAEDYYNRAVKWAESSGNKRAASWVNLSMGHNCRLRRDWDEAEKYYALSLERCGNDEECRYVRWAVAVERARLFARQRSFAGAVEQLERAMELSKELRASAECEEVVLVEFGRLYSTLAKGELSQLYFRRALKQAEEDSRAAVLAELYASLNGGAGFPDKEQAIAYAEKAYALSAGLGPELELEALHSLAGSYLFLKPERSPEGFELASRMRVRAREIGYVDYETTALALMSMAKYATKNIDEMIQLATESLALTVPNDEDPTASRIALQLLADGEIGRGNYRAALAWCLKALQGVESAWAKEGVEELRQDLLSQSKAICTQIMIELNALNSSDPSSEYAREAFDYCERSRCRSLFEQLLPRGHTDHLPLAPQVLKQDQDLRARLSAVRAQLALVRTANTPSRQTLHSLQEERAKLITKHMKFQAEMQGSAPHGFRGAHLAPLTSEEIQRRLLDRHPNTAALCYQLGIQKSFVIVLTRDSCSLLELPDWTILSKYVREWHLKMLALQTAKQSEHTYLEQYDLVAHHLYDVLVKPAERLIAGRDLLIVPSDALSGMAFEALVVNDPGKESIRSKYFVEEHAITYAPSLSALVGIESRSQHKKAARRLVLIGGRSVDGTETRIRHVGDHPFVATLPGIPAAQREIRYIARIAQRKGIVVTIWMGPESGQGLARGSDLSRFGYVHIAAHGISDSQDGGASALMLSLDSKGDEKGVVTSDDIASLKLNTDLVVLSACQTGTGQTTSAEGVLGLTRAFLIAGARSVCSSLWPVEDEWTQRLMSAFYQMLLSRGMTKSRALRLAKLDLIRQGANPSQWAPFVQAGSPR